MSKETKGTVVFFSVAFGIFGLFLAFAMWLCFDQNEKENKVLKKRVSEQEILIDYLEETIKDSLEREAK